MFMERTLGDLKPIIDQLQELVPFEGACESPRSKNKALDKYRRATNCVYDFFNNGLINRRSQFVRIFGNAPYIDSFVHMSPDRWDRWEDIIAPKYKAIILDAAKEQGIQSDSKPSYLDLYSEEVK